MEVTINIDTVPELTLKELSSYTCVSAVIFTLTVDQLLQEKIQRIMIYMPYLNKFPTVKTQIVVKGVETIPLKTFGVVALGGTFDYLHIGHQILLLYAVLAAKTKVIIGTTGPGMLINKKDK